MLSHLQGSAEKSLRTRQDERVLSRVAAKETSMANASSRVLYYGDAPVAVPFTWESKPGTPKHPLSETSLPPLTPPPSYHSKSVTKRRGKSKAHIFSDILAGLAGSGKVHESPSLSSSSSSSLVYSSPSLSLRDKDEGVPLKHEGANGCTGCTPFGNIKRAMLKIVGD